MIVDFGVGEIYCDDGKERQEGGVFAEDKIQDRDTGRPHKRQQNRAQPVPADTGQKEQAPLSARPLD